MSCSKIDEYMHGRVESTHHMKDGTKPIFIKLHRVPYALKHEIEKELDKL